jgi:DNA-directed RNA polymerase specialized sigma24 family protein
LQATLYRLSPRCREAVMLKKIEGLIGREIAAHMGLTWRAVHQRRI